MVVWHAASRERLGGTLLEDPWASRRGVTAATVFHDKARDVRCVVHGDGFTFLGWEEDLPDVRDGMKAKLKVRGVLVECGETSVR